MNIKGKYYIPEDNSWCINVNTQEDAFIAKDCCNQSEKDAIFIIDKAPYIAKVEFDVHENEKRKCVKTFVNVKSLKTGNIYRVLYNINNVQ